MKILELLQSVFWSKKALLRSLIGLGILIVTVVLIAGVWYEAELRWLTPGERKAGKAALGQIDSLQNLELISRKDFEAKESGLREKLDRAHQAAWTLLDGVVASELYFYLHSTERERAAVWEQHRMQPGDSSIAESDRELNRRAISDEKESVRLHRAFLHKALE